MFSKEVITNKSYSYSSTIDMYNRLSCYANRLTNSCNVQKIAHRILAAVAVTFVAAFVCACVFSPAAFIAIPAFIGAGLAITLLSVSFLDLQSITDKAQRLIPNWKNEHIDGQC